MSLHEVPGTATIQLALQQRRDEGLKDRNYLKDVHADLLYDDALASYTCLLIPVLTHSAIQH